VGCKITVLADSKGGLSQNRRLSPWPQVIPKLRVLAELAALFTKAWISQRIKYEEKDFGVAYHPNPATIYQFKPSHLAEAVIRGHSFFGPWWAGEGWDGESPRDGESSSSTSTSGTGLVASADCP
jgi:hypothetical protein